MLRIWHSSTISYLQNLLLASGIEHDDMKSYRRKTILAPVNQEQYEDVNSASLHRDLENIQEPIDHKQVMSPTRAALDQSLQLTCKALRPEAPVVQDLSLCTPEPLQCQLRGCEPPNIVR